MKKGPAQYQSLHNAATPLRYLHLSYLNMNFTDNKYSCIRANRVSYQEMLKGTSFRSQRTLSLLMKLAIWLKMKSGLCPKDLSVIDRYTNMQSILQMEIILTINKYIHRKSQTLFIKNLAVCFSSTSSQTTSALIVYNFLCWETKSMFSFSKLPEYLLLHLFFFFTTILPPQLFRGETTQTNKTCLTQPSKSATTEIM